MRLLFSHRSDTGRVRPSNQDACSIDRLEGRADAALLVVADGMGGYEGGEIASHLAVGQVRTRVLASVGQWVADGLILDGLSEAMAEANRVILQAQREQPANGNMGTTLTVAIIWGEMIYIGHVGDSKACLVGSGPAHKITSDHNVAGELLESGHLTADEAAVHPQRNVLTRALGVGEHLRVERVAISWQQGDTLLLYTDGLSSLVPLAEIEQQCRQSLDGLANRLVDLANDRGGNDNITVLAARWEG